MRMKYGLPRLELEKATPEELEYRRRMVIHLENVQGNVSEAAKNCRMSRSSFYRRLHYLGIKVDRKGRKGKRRMLSNPLEVRA